MDGHGQSGNSGQRLVEDVYDLATRTDHGTIYHDGKYHIHSSKNTD